MQAAGEGHWLRWIEEDIVAWRERGSTAHHRSAYGGMGSFNDLYLTGAQAEPGEIWLEVALNYLRHYLRHVAASVAPFAEQSSEGFRQVPPGSSTTSLAGVAISVCGRCQSRFVTSSSILFGAAAAWCSWTVPTLVQDQQGETIADHALGLAPEDDREEYVGYVNAAINRAGIAVADYDSYATWSCPSCGHRQWRTSSVGVF
ncbi:MAG: hypothetical protein WCC60_17355 [Ilumatobacteraceae bacterium]